MQIIEVLHTEIKYYREIRAKRLSLIYLGQKLLKLNRAGLFTLVQPQPNPIHHSFDLFVDTTWESS